MSACGEGVEAAGRSGAAGLMLLLSVLLLVVPAKGRNRVHRVHTHDEAWPLSSSSSHRQAPGALAQGVKWMSWPLQVYALRGHSLVGSVGALPFSPCLLSGPLFMPGTACGSAVWLCRMPSRNASARVSGPVGRLEGAGG